MALGCLSYYIFCKSRSITTNGRCKTLLSICVATSIANLGLKSIVGVGPVRPAVCHDVSKPLVPTPPPTPQTRDEQEQQQRQRMLSKVFLPISDGMNLVVKVEVDLSACLLSGRAIYNTIYPNIQQTFRHRCPSRYREDDDEYHIPAPEFMCLASGPRRIMRSGLSAEAP